MRTVPMGLLHIGRFSATSRASPEDGPASACQANSFQYRMKGERSAMRVVCVPTKEQRTTFPRGSCTVQPSMLPLRPRLKVYWMGVVSTLSLVSRTKTASSFAGWVLLAFRLIEWIAPGNSDQLSPAR